MAEIHPSATVQGEVELAADVTIGPNCVLDGKTGPIRIGSGTRLIGSAWLAGPLAMGEGNIVYPFTTLGFAPQDLKWDPARPGAGVEIGNANTFRESVTIHRATSDETPTRIGDRNYWMAASHAGHDAQVGSHCIFANAAALGGHVRVDDRVTIGGGTVIHQFVRIGRGAMLSGAGGASLDVPPWFMITGINIAGSVNLIGLRRSGMDRSAIDEIRWVYRTLYREGRSVKSAIEAMRERAESEVVREYIEFIETSKRGICPGTGRAIRGMA